MYYASTNLINTFFSRIGCDFPMWMQYSLGWYKYLYSASQKDPAMLAHAEGVTGLNKDVREEIDEDVGFRNAPAFKKKSAFLKSK